MAVGINLARVTASGTWMFTRPIYRFDPDLVDALVDTPLTDALPCDALFTLPEWCVYIDTQLPFLDGFIKGFWVHLEWDTNNNWAELRFLLNIDKELRPIAIHLGNWSLSAGINKFIAEAENNLAYYLGQTNTAFSSSEMISSHFLDITKPLVLLTLYLCSEKPDIV